MKTKIVIWVVVLSLLLALSGPGLAFAAPPTPRPDSSTQQVPLSQPQRVSPETPSNGVAPDTQAQPGLRVVESDRHHVVLELLTPDFQVEQSVADGGSCDLITVADYGEMDAAGRPRLPVGGALVGIPPHADLTLTVLAADPVVVAQRFNLCPVRQPILGMDSSGEIRYEGEEAVRDTNAYATDGFYPASVAEVVSTGFARSQRIAQLVFHPFQYNPVSHELRQYRSIRVQLDFTTSGQGAPQSAERGRGQQGNQGDHPRQPNHPAGNDSRKVARRWYTPETVQLQLVSTTAEQDPFGEAPTVVNSDVAGEWLVQPESSTTPAGAASQGQSATKILVDEDGIYQVTYTDLQTAGVDVNSVDPRTFQLHSQGEEVAIYVAGEEDGVFGPDDYFLFYGQKMNTRYTDTSVYWLTWSGASGRRMALVEGSPTGVAPVPPYFQTTQHVEENRAYQSNYASGPDRDRWYWDYIYASGAPASKAFAFTLQHVSAAPFNAVVRGLFRGYTAYPQHHTRVYLNGHLISDATWPSTAEYTFTANVTQSYLIEGSNVISVEAPLDGGITQDILFVNWFEIDYAKTYVADEDLLFFGGSSSGAVEYHVGGFATDAIELFDITTPSSPVRVIHALVGAADSGYGLAFEDASGGERRYVALARPRMSHPLSIEGDRPSDLVSTANGADYIIITHGDFYAAVLPLAEYRAAQGLRVAVVDVQDIYDEFSAGVFEPEAIRDFLTYAYNNWLDPSPSYVLLVGDGNYDFRNYMGYGEPNYIPPYMANVDLWIGEVAADNRYACVSGDDVFPDMYLGRLPAKTSAEAAAMVAKIMDYEQNPAGGDWNQRVLFVADNPDGAGDFYAYSDAVANGYLPAPYSAQKVYYGRTHPTSSGAQAAIMDAINQGQLVVNYVGHGSIQVWAQEHLFEVSRVAALTNAGRLPLVAAMACSDGYFIIPSPSGADYSSTAEALVRAPAKGAIASWSATGLGLAYAHDYLNKGLFEAIFLDGIVQLGPATTMGKLYLYSRTGGYRDQIDEYTLFGDPALRLNVVRADVSMAQGVDPAVALQAGEAITYTLTYFNAGPATARHVVISDTLPAALLNPAVTSTGAVVTPRTGSGFVWDVADLAAGEGGVITVTARVSLRFAGALANTAAIATAAVEADMANNVMAVSTDVTPADTTAIHADAGPDQTANEGEAVNFTGAFDGAALPDGLTVAWDLGDGATASDTLTPAHVYADEGVYTVTLTVRDEQGVLGSDTLAVTIRNVAPTVDAGPAQTANEGEVTRFDGVFADPGLLDTHTIAWDLGDGATASDTLTPAHAYADEGVYTVTLTVADDGGGVGSDTLVVIVRNVAPTVSAWATPVLAQPRQAIAFGGAFTDPGSLDTHAIQWNFGDGTLASGSLTVTHTYTLGGFYTATLTVTDGDGGAGQASVPVGVSYELYPLAIHADSAAGASIGQELRLPIGDSAGNLGFLSWTGDQSAGVLVQSLTPPGDSGAYVNPRDAGDRTLSTGDWVYGLSSVKKSRDLLAALDTLKGMVITIPVWDQTYTQKHALPQVHVVGFARVQITGYSLSGQTYVSVIFQGNTDCPGR